jgi:hypothetical protein
MKVHMSQSDYKIFKSKVKLLASMGINVNYSVSKPNHKRVKVVMNEQYDWAQLDRLCDKDTKWEDPLGYGY